MRYRYTTGGAGVGVVNHTVKLNGARVPVGESEGRPRITRRVGFTGLDRESTLPRPTLLRHLHHLHARHGVAQVGGWVPRHVAHTGVRRPPVSLFSAPSPRKSISLSSCATAAKLRRGKGKGGTKEKEVYSGSGVGKYCGLSQLRRPAAVLNNYTHGREL